MSLTRSVSGSIALRIGRLMVSGLIASFALSAATQNISMEDTTQSASPKILMPDWHFIDPVKATISSNMDAGGLLDKIIKNATADPRFFKYGTWPWNAEAAGFYCIMHVVHWADPVGDNPQKADKQNWYLYNGSKGWAQDDFAANKRIFGVKKIALMYVYLNKDVNDAPDVRYDISVTSKVPANVQHLFDLASAFVVTPQEGAKKKFQGANFYGIADFNVSYVPSDMSVTPYLVAQDGARTQVGDSIVFDNEGTYYWDVSVAVPIRKMGQLQLNNVNNTVTAQNPDKKNVFAVLDLYPWKKDVKAQTFDLRPYAVAGVAIGSQPLHKILVGAGWGPKFAQFYAGALFVRQQTLTTLTPGSVATPAQQAADTRMTFKPQFAFGINLPVREVFHAATSKTPKASSGGTPATPAVKTNQPAGSAPATPQAAKP